MRSFHRKSRKQSTRKLRKFKINCSFSSLVIDKHAAKSSVLRLRGGVDDDCQFWTVQRVKFGRAQVDQCLKTVGENDGTCNKCEMNLCLPCHGNHVCDYENISTEYDDIMSDPRILVKWMFRRLKACLICISKYNNAAGKSKWSSDHDIQDIFKASIGNGHNDFKEDFTELALKYWAVLKSKGEKYSQFITSNCNIRHRRDTITMSNESKFSDVDCENLCKRIEEDLSLHNVIPDKVR